MHYLYIVKSNPSTGIDVSSKEISGNTPDEAHKKAIKAIAKIRSKSSNWDYRISQYPH